MTSARPSTTQAAAGGPATGSFPIVATGTVGMVVISALWVTSIVVVARAGWFAAGGDGPPWPVVLAVLVPVTLAAVALRRRPIAQAVLGLDPQLVVAIQLWRVVGAAFLFGWADGTLHATFAIPAGIGDIATGLAALVVVARMRAGTLTRRAVLTFTALGIGDFVVALATGAVVRIDAVEQLPWVLFPALAVPAFSVAHLITWLQLGRVDSNHGFPG